jgi:hypothetical protein
MDGYERGKSPGMSGGMVLDRLPGAATKKPG